jgi:signal peptidase I
MRSLGIAFLLFLLIRTFFFEAFQIPSGSMEGTLLAGDFLFVNKVVYGATIPGTERRLPALSEPGRGEVIVFAFPQDRRMSYVKRVVAVGGDTVAMRRGRLVVNGQLVSEPYVRQRRVRRDVAEPDFVWQRAHFTGSDAERGSYRPTRSTWGPLLVPAGHYFVLGDNRDHSSDSRYWGFVNEGLLRGRPAFVYFSYDREAPSRLPWVTDIRWERLGEPVH